MEISETNYNKLKKTELTNKNKSEFSDDGQFKFSTKELQHIFRIIQTNLFVVFVWENKPGWPIKYVTDNVSDIFGYTASELINTEIQYSNIIYPEDLKELQQQRIAESQKISDKKFSTKTYRITDKSGNLHYVEDRTIIVREPNGEIKYYEGIIHDVTEKKTTEEQLLFRLELETIIAKVSSFIVKAGLMDIKEALSYASRVIADFLHVDYSFVVLNKSKTNKYCVCFEYSPSHSERISQHYHEKSLNEFKWFIKKISDGKPLIIQNTNIIESTAVEEKRFFKNCKVKSVIIIPFRKDLKVTGFLAFYFSKNYSKFSKKDSSILKYFSVILSNAYKNHLIAIERKKIEDEMRKLTQAVNQSANAIVITDADGKIEFVNPKFEEISGYSLKEVIGKKPNILKSGHTKADEYKKLWDTILEGKIWAGEFKNISKSGEAFWERATISPIMNNRNVITNFIAIKEDITKQIDVQNQLALAQKMESIGQLAAGIAHEINTPLQYVGDNINFLSDSYKAMLNVLYDFSAFLEDGNEYSNNEIREFYQRKKEEMDLEFIYEEVPQAIEQTIGGIDKVTKIVRAMKDFAHPGVKKKAYQNLNKGIEDTVIISKNEWKYVAEIELKLASDIPAVFCLLDELNQVFLNLIVNAAHAIAEKIGDRPEVNLKGSIVIESRKINLDGEDNIEIKISDSGNGIKKGNINKIFDPFFTTKEVGKGTGQGLAIAHDIVVNKHNGKIYVDSELGKGTTFTIVLPIEDQSDNKK